MWCAVIAAALLVPFLNKAFHIDDPVYLWVAKQIHVEPLDYYGFDVNWGGHTVSIAKENKNPPGVSYFIALAALVTGWSEPGLHAVFLIPAALLALGVYALAARLCTQPAYATMIAVVSPVTVVSATNVMTDVLMTALFVWSIVAWLRAVEDNNTFRYLVAGLLIALAALTKYFALSLIPLLAVYSMLVKRPVRQWAPALLLSVAVYGAYEWHSITHYGESALLSAILYAGPERSASGKTLLQQTITALSFSGGCMAALLFLAPLALTGRRLLAAALATLALLGALVVLPIGNALLVNVRPSYHVPALVQIALWCAVGIGLLVMTAKDVVRCRDPHAFLLSAWIGGTFVFAAYANWSVTARTILPLVPPAAILAVRRIETQRSWFTERPWSWRTVVPLALTAALSLSVARADVLLANSARTAAAQAAQSLAGYPGTVYFLGQWGFQYYMQQAGKTPIDFEKAHLSPRDLVISPMNNSNVVPLRKEYVLTQSAMRVPVCRWLTPMFTGMGAGFYSDLWGPLPFAFGPVPPEMYVTSTIAKSGNPFDPAWLP